MKKFLLLAMTAGTVLSVSAELDVTARKNVEAAAEVQLAKSTKEVAMPASKASLQLVSLDQSTISRADFEDLKSGINQVHSVMAAEAGFVSKPYYFLPDGAFFGRTILDGQDGSYVRRPLFLPGNVDMTWTNATMWDGDYPTDDAFSFTWKYNNVVEQNGQYGLDPATQSGIDGSGHLASLTTNYPMYVNGIPTPAIEFCGTSYGDGTVGVAGGGEAEKYLIRSGGYPTGKVTSGTYEWSLTNFDFYQYNGWGSNGAVCETYDDFVFGSYSNWCLNSNSIFNDANVPGYAMLLNIPEGKQFGVTQVVVNCWVDAVPTAPVKLDFYTLDFAEDPAQPGYGWRVAGKRIGGGWLNPEEMSASDKNQRITIPMREGEGDFVSETFVNLTGSVLAVIYSESDEDTSVSFPTVIMDADKSTWKNFGFHVLDKQRGPVVEGDPISGKQLYAFSSLSFSNFWNIAKPKLLGIDMNYVGAYTDIVLPADATTTTIDGETYLEVVFSGAEEEKTVVVEPYFNMESMGKFTVNEEADDWLYAYADAWNANYEQPLVIQADPLPSGVSGRIGYIKAEIPGAVLNILVRQGDTSGIDTIEGDDANVVSSQIFDLQGRQLNAVPESGLYIRRDVKADNTITTTKVVK